MTEAETQLAAALRGLDWNAVADRIEQGDGPDAQLAVEATNALVAAILAALAQHGLTVARSDDVEVGAALRLAQEALPEGWDGPEFKHEQVFNGRDAKPMYGPEREWIAYAWLPDRTGADAYHGPTIAAAARALTAELRKERDV